MSDDRPSVRPRRDPGRARLISPRDLALLGYFALLAVPAWLLTERWLPIFARALARLSTGLRPDRARRDAEALAKLFGDRLKSPPLRVHTDIVGNAHLHQMLYVRARRPGGWQPRMRIEGADHLLRPLEEGRGVIVWNAPLVLANLLTKVALAQAGFRAVHLSHLHHNLSDTKFGTRVLNSLPVGAERRFLGDRLVMRPDSRLPALRELRRRLERNAVVSITAIGGGGLRAYDVPFLDGTLSVPAGAIELSGRTGAALLPAFSYRDLDGSFVTRIEPPVSTAAEFVALLEDHLTHRPDQCSTFLYRVTTRGARRARRRADRPT